MEEIWVNIIGYEKFYQISNFSRVKSLEQKSIAKDGRRQNLRKEKILKPFKSIGKHRYYSVKLRSNDGEKPKTYMLHRLVAIHFIPNPENKPQVNHINAIKTDNRIENLEWCTREENIKHSVIMNLQVCKRGTECNFSKLSEKDVLKIRKISEYTKVKEISNIYEISMSHVYFILQRKVWKHI